MFYYTSDLHFGHRNVLKFDNRPFANVDEMDLVLIENWNNRVQPDDAPMIIGYQKRGSFHPQIPDRSSSRMVLS